MTNVKGILRKEILYNREKKACLTVRIGINALPKFPMVIAFIAPKYPEISMNALTQ